MIIAMMMMMMMRCSCLTVHIVFVCSFVLKEHVTEGYECMHGRDTQRSLYKCRIYIIKHLLFTGTYILSCLCYTLSLFSLLYSLHDIIQFFNKSTSMFIYKFPSYLQHRKIYYIKYL